MKKKTVSKKSLTENAIEKLPIFEDPTAPYGKSIQALPSIKDFTFNEFKIMLASLFNIGTSTIW
jgi:hypothetical protein